MQTPLYTARIGDAVSLAERAPYPELVRCVLEFVLRAAIACAIDQFSWEEEEVRRGGLRRIEFAREGRALWWDAAAFHIEKNEAKREGVIARFTAENALDVAFFEKLDGDFRERLRCCGYATSSLLGNMKKLFEQIAAEVADRSAAARETLISEIVGV